MLKLILKELYFSAGHRIKGHEKCKVPHGHTYFVQNITYVPKVRALDKMGMIIDFGDLKGPIRDYFKSQWDHKMIIPDFAEEVIAWTELYEKLGLDISSLKPLTYTTAEHMAVVIKGELEEMFENAIEIKFELLEGPLQGVSV